MIVYTLREIESLPALLQTMKEARRAGDKARPEAVALKPMDSEFPDLTDRLLADRSKAWLPKIEAMLETEAVELILVEALHLAGEDDLLSLLKLRGYTVEVQSPRALTSKEAAGAIIAAADIRVADQHRIKTSVAGFKTLITRHDPAAGDSHAKWDLVLEPR